MASVRPHPHSSIEPQKFGLPKARIKRQIHVAESATTEVDPDTMLNTTLSGPCRSASRQRVAAVRSSASSQVIRCQPGSGSPLRPLHRMEQSVPVIDELRRRSPLRADRLAGRMQGIGLQRDESPVLHHRDRAASRDAERAVARDSLDRRHERDYGERRTSVSTRADVYARFGFGYGVAMNSRWDDTAASDLSDLDLLVYASRLVGAETSLVVWGGGNT